MTLRHVLLTTGQLGSRLLTRSHCRCAVFGRLEEWQLAIRPKICNSGAFCCLLGLVTCTDKPAEEHIFTWLPPASEEFTHTFCKAEFESHEELMQPSVRVQVSGFLPRDPSYADTLRQAQVSTPTLFIHGSTDELVPLERAYELQATFAEGTTAMLEHPGAHFVPTCTGAVKQQIVHFLDKF